MGTIHFSNCTVSYLVKLEVLLISEISVKYLILLKYFNSSKYCILSGGYFRSLKEIVKEWKKLNSSTFFGIYSTTFVHQKYEIFGIQPEIRGGV